MLACGECGLVEILDQFVKQSVPVDLGFQVHEHRTKTNCSPVHEHELARRSNSTQPAYVAVDALDHRSTVDPVRFFLYQARSVIE